MDQQQECRRRARLSLRYQLQLWRVEGQVSLEAETYNISSSGFYCTASEPFSPGEYLECRIVIPSQSTPLVLDRQVRVIRVEIKGLEPGFGVACEFTDREGVLREVAYTSVLARAIEPTQGPYA
jgi:PilZ domain